jgi:stress-induced-phosphoprotein 1
LFKQQKWPEAIKAYDEALKRDPTNHKTYSNRSACYSKLTAWSESMKDIEKCLEIDPTFVKAYIRKGKLHHVLKQYHKAMMTFEKGLEIDPDASELKKGLQATMQAIQNENQSGEIDPARRAEAMKDPEIQRILRDPEINTLLSSMQQGAPDESMQRLMQRPDINEKLQKLIAAGIIRTQ